MFIVFLANYWDFSSGGGVANGILRHAFILYKNDFKSVSVKLKNVSVYVSQKIPDK